VIFSFELYANDINKVTYAYWDKPDVELFYALPKVLNKNTKVLFIIHGSSRDARRYLNAWQEDSKNKNVILVAPLFTKENYSNYTTLQMSTSSGRLFKNQSKHLKNSISSFYAFFRSKYNLDSSTYRIFGFSGGSQFIHRYLMYGEDQNIEKAAIGSAGWYTFLNSEPFPFGTGNMPIDRERYEWFLSRQVLFVLGGKDDNPNHSTLNSSKGAKNQGDHRLERGQNYFKNLVAFGEEFQIPFRWRYKVVSNLGHNTEEMTKNAIPFLLEGLDYAD
jgi:hypothetical protein